jgi:hypothetical protein
MADAAETLAHRGVPAQSCRMHPDDRIAAAARAHGPEAVQRLAEILRGDDPAACVEAAVALLNFGFGLPEQTLRFDAGGVTVEVNAAGEVDRRSNGEASAAWTQR